MSEALHAPQIDNCIRWLWHSCDAGSMVQPAYSEQTRADLDRLFSILRQLKPTGENGHAPRGSLADYGDYEEYLEDGAVDSEEEFEALWRADYPQETVWYHFAATEDAAYGFRMVSVGRRLVFIEQESREKGFPLDGTELSGWLVQAVAEVLQQVKAGVYNVFVEENLPAEHRVGTISRAAYWQIWPEEKESFFATLSPVEIEDCLQNAQETGEALPGRLAQLTANDFFRFCALGYQANGYHGAEKPPKEQYRLHADGRDGESFRPSVGGLPRRQLDARQPVCDARRGRILPCGGGPRVYAHRGGNPFLVGAAPRRRSRPSARRRLFERAAAGDRACRHRTQRGDSSLLPVVLSGRTGRVVHEPAGGKPGAVRAGRPLAAPGTARAAVNPFPERSSP